MLQKDRAFVVETLKQYRLRLGIENHPESVDELLEKIGDGGDGTIAATVDTGWVGTQGVDAAEALRQLGPHLLVIYLHEPDFFDPTNDITASLHMLKGWVAE